MSTSAWTILRQEVRIGRMWAEEEFAAYQQHQWVQAAGISSRAFRFRRMPTGKIRSWVYYRTLLWLVETHCVSQSESDTDTH